MPERRTDILVTGANGFVGEQLMHRLAAARSGDGLVGVDLTPAATAPRGWSSVACDLTDAAAVRELIASLRPLRIVHLAAQSHVPTAFENPIATWRVNAMGTLHLLDAVRRETPDCLFVHVSTAEVYGHSFAAGEPLGEDAPFAPLNPYASSKAAADLMVRQFARDDVRSLVLRPFNHVGPGQREDFVVAAFCAQIARIEAGVQEPVIRVGNLEARRDFLDVRDVLAAYVAVLARGDALAPGSVFNICSGRATAIAEILDDLRGLSKVPIKVRVDPERLRPVEIPVAVGGADAARAALGWEPLISWQKTLADTLDDWRRRVREERKA